MQSRFVVPLCLQWLDRGALHRGSGTAFEVRRLVHQGRTPSLHQHRKRTAIGSSATRVLKRTKERLYLVFWATSPLNATLSPQIRTKFRQSSSSEASNLRLLCTVIRPKGARTANMFPIRIENKKYAAFYLVGFLYFLFADLTGLTVLLV